ncbi:SDR family NAD(P)-dependent oxidoreductase [Conexibacter sp. DBS9H8]|uniref:SDR family NAD(P)-dependent oxidoreductase n=1 Tax=Conexibacter sp. DBS9H8 TaxID=2937801 RepID=UPI00201010C4|nr:SDR family NAD(P)-dependent oxidoreductase [Conexibacter sp. DBS9H8]
MTDPGTILSLPGMEGRVAVVTGARQGIGAEIARELRRQGARVVVFDVAAPDDAAIEGCRFVHCDVGDEATVERAFADVEAVEGLVSILVNNAGILRRAAVVDQNLASWDEILRVNLTGGMLCSRRALPAMQRERYGRIVFIGSSAGQSGGYGLLSAYGASKAGVMGFAKWLATENAEYGITCNVVAPAAIDTEMLADVTGFEKAIPVGRMGTPADVAAAVTFLCSTAAGYMTGEVMDVNGGYLMD